MVNTQVDQPRIPTLREQNVRIGPAKSISQTRKRLLQSKGRDFELNSKQTEEPEMPVFKNENMQKDLNEFVDQMDQQDPIHDSEPKKSEIIIKSNDI